MPDSTHLEARNYETYSGTGYDAMNVKEDTIHKISNEGYEDASHVEKVATIIENHYEEVEDEEEAYTEQVKMPKTVASTSFGPTDPQRAMPYFIEDGSTPD